MNLQMLSSLRPYARTVARAALLTLTLSLSHALIAQGPMRPVATADIPFAFSAGAKVLPAGHYTFAMVTPHVYALQQANGMTVQYISAFAAETPKKSDTSVVHFNRYGSSYFLEGAWFATAQDGIDLAKGKAEKEMQAAVKMPNPDSVVVALNTGGNRK